MYTFYYFFNIFQKRRHTPSFSLFVGLHTYQPLTDIICNHHWISALLYLNACCTSACTCGGNSLLMHPVHQQRTFSPLCYHIYLYVDHYCNDNCKEVKRGLGKISNPRQSRLCTGGPSSQPAAAWRNKDN